MLNFRKGFATTALLLTLSLTAQAGWISTGAKPTPTPEPTTYTAPDDVCEAEKLADWEEHTPLDVAADTFLSFLRDMLTML
jgi:hypothetical protein